MSGPAGLPAEGADGADLEQGWRLSGRDGEGRPVSLLFGDTALRRAYPGLTVGRHPALADLVVDDASVSRRHIRLCREGEAMIVEDLNSLNGSAVDGQDLRPFEPVAMAAGQVLAVGGVDLRLERLDPGERLSRASDGALAVDRIAADDAVAPLPPGPPAFDAQIRRPAMLAGTVATLVLSALTFGVIWFWGRTRHRRQVWSALRFGGASFRYTGRGSDLAFGFLCAAGIIAPAAVALVLAVIILGDARPAAAMAAAIGGAVLGIGLWQGVRFRMIRYRVGETVWRGERFQLHGSTLAWAVRGAADAVMTLASLGIAYPWIRVAALRRRIDGLRFGPARFHSEAGGAALLLPWSLTLACLTLPPLGFAVLNVEFTVALFDPALPLPVDAPGAEPLAAPWLPALVALAVVPYAWFRIEEWRQVVNHLRCSVAGTRDANARAEARTAAVLAIAVPAVLVAAVLWAALAFGFHALIDPGGPLADTPRLNLAIAGGLAGLVVVPLVGFGWLEPAVLPHLAATTSFDTLEPFLAAAGPPPPPPGPAEA